ncbi:MAG: helix-turn-helix domain-containing protein, partial [Bacteroidaceae bacterium]|nr:helix-turn-helix domain-containing protein [Bacteroidaceae bacterium]
RQKQYLNALRKKNQTIDQMHQSLDDIGQHLMEKQEALEQVEEMLRDREKELESLNARVSRAATELAGKDEDLRVARAELGKARRQVKTQQEKIEMSRAELKRAQKKVQDLVSCEVAARADGETTSLVSRIVNEARTSRTGTAEISDAEWNILAAHIEAMHPGFHQSLKEGVRDVSPQKLHAALLWKIGMSKAQIARQLSFSRPTASRWVDEFKRVI